MKVMHCRECQEDVEVEDDKDETQTHDECGGNLTRVGYVKEAFATVRVDDIFQGNLPEQWKVVRVELVVDEGVKVVRFTFKIDWNQN